MIATDPFATEEGISARGMKTYRTIADRLAGLNPKIFIHRHIAAKQGKTGYSTLKAADSTLDGITFIADDPKLLASAFDRAVDFAGQPFFASMKEYPDQCALSLSFRATKGTGWRETWRAGPFVPASEIPGSVAPRSLGMRFGTAGHPFRFAALHCAVHEIGGTCNVHIDEAGFVLGLPKGVALTADMYGHIVNELVWKTDINEWLAGKFSSETGKKIVREIFRRVSFNFPNAANGYQGLGGRINSFRRPQTPGDLVVMAVRTALPIGVSVDAWDTKYFTTQGTVAWTDGDITITLSVGGNW